jgi:hypothetical protein
MLPAALFILPIAGGVLISSIAVLLWQRSIQDRFDVILLVPRGVVGVTLLFLALLDLGNTVRASSCDGRWQLSALAGPDGRRRARGGARVDPVDERRACHPYRPRRVLRPAQEWHPAALARRPARCRGRRRICAPRRPDLQTGPHTSRQLILRWAAVVYKRAHRLAPPAETPGEPTFELHLGDHRRNVSASTSLVSLSRQLKD